MTAPPYVQELQSALALNLSAAHASHASLLAACASHHAKAPDTGVRGHPPRRVAQHTQERACDASVYYNTRHRQHTRIREPASGYATPPHPRGVRISLNPPHDDAALGDAVEALAKEFIAVLTAVKAEASAVVGAVAPSGVKPKVRPSSLPPQVGHTRPPHSPHQVTHCCVWTSAFPTTIPHRRSHGPAWSERTPTATRAGQKPPTLIAF